MNSYKEIDRQEDFKALLNGSRPISRYVFQNIDFTEFESEIWQYSFEDNLFLGCIVPDLFFQVYSISNVFIPQFKGLPYNSFPKSLYDRKSLLGEYVPGKPESYENTFDNKVHKHFIRTGIQAKSIHETLARRLHDHAITDNLEEFISQWDEKKVVAVMGGHNLLRSDENYEVVIRVSKKLTEDGYLMVSGGGPGAMEATHVGAWLAGMGDHLIREFIETLSEAPVYTHKLWLDKAFQLINKYPNGGYESLGIPTWLYGHEPPTPFATRIAKYFANSVREDGLLTIAKGGIIFAPGSAGTIQEIFQDATQNHYLSFGYASPMVFLNKTYWTSERPIYPLLKTMTDEGKYKNLLLSTANDEAEVVEIIKSFTADDDAGRDLSFTP